MARFSALIPERLPHTAVVSAIDLDLDDLGHVGTPGLKRLGRRLALIALRNLYGQKGGRPKPQKVSKVPSSRGLPDLVVKFKGVNVTGTPPLGLQPPRPPPPAGRGVPRIFDAAVGPTPNCVTLKLTGPDPERAGAVVRLRPRPLLQPDGQTRHGGARLSGGCVS